MIPAGILASARVARGALAYIGNVSSPADQSTYTFSSTALGAADPTRVIVLTVAARGGFPSPDVTSATIGGIAATIDVTYSSVGGDVTQILRAAVPTGTPGTIVVNFNGTVTRTLVGVYSITGYGTVTPVATGGDALNVSSSSMTTAAMTTAAGDLIVAGCSYTNATDATWTGVTEDYDTTVEILFSGAHGVASGTSTTVSVAINAATQFKTMAAVAYRGS
jgi:hypothetical protein